MSKRDLQLVAGCLAGEAAAFESLFEAHAGRTKAYFLRCGFQPTDAEDLMQESFVRAFKSLDTFDAGKGALTTWLGAIARNVARKQWAKRALPDSFDPELAEQMFATRDNPGDHAAGREELQAVSDCIALLPVELGRLVRLRYVEGRTTRGVGEVIEMPESTVRGRLDEARSKLRWCMKQKGFRV